MQTRLEKLNLALPVFFLFPALVVYLFNFKISEAASDNLRWLALILFFNGLHVVFTFGHLLYLPEFKELQKLKRMSWGRHLLVLTLIFGASLYSLTFIPGAWHQNFAKAFSSLFIIFGIFHIRRQSLGISLLYNRPFSRRESLCRRIEKTACLLGVMSSILLGQTLSLSIVSPTVSLRLGQGLACLSLSLLAGSIFFLEDKDVSFKKMVFNQRFLLHTFSPASILCGLGSLSVHGIEYCVMDQKLRKNTQASADAKKQLFLFLVLGCLFLAVTYSVPKAGQWETLQSGLLVNILISAAISVSFYHYYLDGVLYRLRDPDVREQIGSLILPASRPSSMAWRRNTH